MTRGICQECARFGAVHIHHKDGNHSNDAQDNRKKLCPSCHKLAHIELLLASTGRPSTQPLAERLPVNISPPSVGMSYIRDQYKLCFPRA